MINIFTVKWGNKYNSNNVNQIYKGLRRFLREPFHIYCFTDDPKGLNPAINIIELPPSIPYWWNKLYMFSKDVPVKGRILYLDLDTVIVGNIDKIAAVDKPFIMLKDVYHPERRGSGLMYWNSARDDFSHLWEKFYPKAREIHEQYWPHGDQVWIQQHLGIEPAQWQQLFPGEILSLKVDCVVYNKKPPKAKIIFYHGKPSIEESLRMPVFAWIKDYWKDES